jgi:hypothetical protein
MTSMKRRKKKEKEGKREIVIFKEKVSILNILRVEMKDGVMMKWMKWMKWKNGYILKMMKKGLRAKD